jgi:hypothetical protein
MRRPLDPSKESALSLRPLLLLFLVMAAPMVQAQWTKLPGQASDIGVGSRGEAWALGVERVDGGNPIFRWRQSDWERVDGGAVRLDVDPQGRPWVVNAAGEILRRDRRDWQRLPGRGRDIGIGANGDVWLVGVESVPGGGPIFRWNGNDWEPMPGGAVRIDVDPRGIPWVVNDRGEVLRFGRDRQWERLPGSGVDLTIGSDGSAWLLGTDRVAGGHSVHRWNGRDWERVDGGGVAVSAGREAWLVNDAGEIFRSSGSR